MPTARRPLLGSCGPAARISWTPSASLAAMNRLAIFDCDGTLVDSGATIHRALAAAFAGHGLELPPADVTRKIIGLSLIEAMTALLPQADAALHRQLAEDYKLAFWQLRAAGQ